MNEAKEILQDKLNSSITIYGLLDSRTIELSKKLDLYIVIEQKNLNNRNKSQ